MKDYDDSVFSAEDGGSAKNDKAGRTKKLAVGILAVLLICGLGLLAPGLLALTEPQPESIGQNGTADTASGVFLSIEMPVGRYTPLMSSVPGMPFRAVCPAADEMRFTTGTGEFLSWDAPDYSVQQQSASFTCAPGDTVYLAPKIGAEPSADQRTVTASAFADGRELGRAVIVLGYDDEFYTVQNVSVVMFQ